MNTFRKFNFLVIIFLFLSVLVTSNSWSNESWIVENLDSTPSVSVSLAIGWSGYPHIAYNSSNWSNLKYLSYNGSDWEAEYVYRSGGYIEGVSLALDKNNRFPHICFVEVLRSHSILWHIKSNGFRWEWERITSKDNSGDFIPSLRIGPRSFVLSSVNRPHVVFLDLNGAMTTLKHAVYADATTGESNWKINEVDGWYAIILASGNVNEDQFPEIVLDSNDNPHFLYSYREFIITPPPSVWKCTIKHAYRSAPPLLYNKNVVDDHSDCMGCYIDFCNNDYALTIDQADKLKICYESRFGLTYKTLTLPINVGSEMDISTARGKGNSITLDDGGYPHVSFMGSDNQLMYGRFDGGNWYLETVDEGLHVKGTPTNIALDEYKDIVHVTFSGTNSALKHAYRCSDLDGDFICDTEDNCPDVPNPNQSNSDGDSFGNACDHCDGLSTVSNYNSDGDRWGDSCDNCPSVDNMTQADSDNDGVGDACDNCDTTPNGPDMGTCTAGSEERVGQPCGPGLNLSCKEQCMDDRIECHEQNCGIHGIDPLCRMCEKSYITCWSECDCGNDGYCSMQQEDCNLNNIGDACDIASCDDSDPFQKHLFYLDEEGVYDWIRALPGTCVDNNCPSAIASLSWEGSAKIGLSIIDPTGKTYTMDESEKSPIQISIPGGVFKGDNWTFSIKALEVPYDDFPIRILLIPENKDHCLDTGHDYDADGVCSTFDNCPEKSNPLQSDIDDDGVGDACDNCIRTPNADQIDSNQDGIGNVCEILRVSIDIKPDDCTDYLNRKAKGVLPVVIHGTKNFDVTQIDPETITLEGVSPIRNAIEDVTNPDACIETPDGYIDLSLKFKNQDIVAALGKLNNEDKFSMVLKANLKKEYHRREIYGQHTVNIIAK